MGIEIDTITFGGDGYIYGARSGPGRRTLYKFDPATAAQTVVGDTGVDSIVGLTSPISTLSVSIDIKPGSDENCFNQNGRGVIPVAVLGGLGFEVSDIDVTTLAFGGLEVRLRGNSNPMCSLEDVNGDGEWDLVCQFEDDSSLWAPGDGEATLSGALLDGTEIEGTDSICIVP